jgi:hypothetical protein
MVLCSRLLHCWQHRRMKCINGPSDGPKKFSLQEGHEQSHTQSRNALRCFFRTVLVMCAASFLFLGQNCRNGSSAIHMARTAPKKHHSENPSLCVMLATILLHSNLLGTLTRPSAVLAPVILPQMKESGAVQCTCPALFFKSITGRVTGPCITLAMKLECCRLRQVWNGLSLQAQR